MEGSKPESKAGRFKCVWLRRLGLVSCIVCLLCLSLGLIPIDRVYSLKAQFERMPSDEQQFVKWLQSQSGIIGDQVYVERDGHTLRIRFIMMQNAYGRPPMPNLSAACESLGYSPKVQWTEDKLRSL